ncbi:hypothetical protein [Endozoicomonas sp. Mp262]|uniref:hypothetical protein n=1 Tax=Endozoicomonas sp. Mp262 TaxID=2919499 RepID=UPI0021D816F8
MTTKNTEQQVNDLFFELGLAKKLQGSLISLLSASRYAREGSIEFLIYHTLIQSMKSTGKAMTQTEELIKALENREDAA